MTGWWRKTGRLKGREGGRRGGERNQSRHGRHVQRYSLYCTHSAAQTKMVKLNKGERKKCVDCASNSDSTNICWSEHSISDICWHEVMHQTLYGCKLNISDETGNYRDVGFVFVASNSLQIICFIHLGCSLNWLCVKFILKKQQGDGLSPLKLPSAS